MFIQVVSNMLLYPPQVFGLLVWALISGSRISAGDGAFGWVIFVAIFLWILTIILFLFYLLNLTSKLPKVPWVYVVGFIRGSVYHSGSAGLQGSQ